MATLTDEDWTTIFEKVQAHVLPLPTNPAALETKIQLSSLKSNPRVVAQFVDHTELKLSATEQDIDKLCDEAVHEGFATVCVRQNYVEHAREQLLKRSGSTNSAVKIACVVGFHEGTYSVAEKSREAELAVAAGAAELDIVLNRDVLKEGRYVDTFTELTALRQAAASPVVLKLIFETSALTQVEVVRTCVLAHRAGFDFVKTSTGFCGRGTSVDDVRLMAACAKYLWETQGELDVGVVRSQKMLVKASGGVRSLQNAIDMITAGASRIGTSGGVRIVQEVSKQDVGDQNTAGNNEY